MASAVNSGHPFVSSIAFTLTATTAELVPPKINIVHAKPVNPDSGKANVGIVIAPPAP